MMQTCLLHTSFVLHQRVNSWNIEPNIQRLQDKHDKHYFGNEVATVLSKIFKGHLVCSHRLKEANTIIDYAAPILVVVPHNGDI